MRYFHSVPSQSPKILRLVFIVAVAWVFVCLNPARAAVAMPSAGDVWFYADMDGTVAPVTISPVLNVLYRQWTGEEMRDKSSDAATFVEGVSGAAVFIGDLTTERFADALTYMVDKTSFPVESGTILMWYRPTHELATTDSWLYHMNHATFSARVRFNGTWLVHATGNHRHSISSPLKRGGWVDRWHLMAVVWNGSSVSAYADGKMIASTTEAEPLPPAISGNLNLGFSGFHSRKGPPTGFADAAYDDVAILSVPMTAEQLATFYAAGVGEGYDGLLAELQPGALVEVDRRAWVRGEIAPVQVTPCGAPGDSLALVVEDGDGRRLASYPVNPEKPSVVSIDTADLCGGRYRLVATTGAAIDDGNATGRPGEDELIIRERRQPEFPFGFFCSLHPDDEALENYEELGVSLLTGNDGGGTGFARAVDRAFAHGICLFPNLNLLPIWRSRYDEWKKQPFWIRDDEGVIRMNPDYKTRIQRTLVWADGTPDPNPEFGSASPYSAISFDMMTGVLDSLLSRVGEHPGLWALSFQDETKFAIRWDREAEKFRVGDYGDDTVAVFKKRTGLKSAAFPPTDPPGTVWPVDHPYLQWIKVVGIPGSDWTAPAFSDLYLRLGQFVKQRRPDIHTSNYSGNEYGLSDYVMDWAYPNVWEPGHRAAWANGGNYLDYMLERHWARQVVRPRKPLWPLLGWWSGDMSDQPAWCVVDFRLNTVLALAKGSQSILWASTGWTASPFSDEKSGLLSHPGLRAETERWCEFLRKKGPLFTRLEKRSSGRVAVLWSETNRVGHVLGKRRQSEFHQIYGGLRNADAMPDLISDHGIRNGDLARYDALVLLDYDYSAEDLWATIEQFAGADGKVVFIDTECTLVPAGAVSLETAWDDWATEIGPRNRTREVVTCAAHLRPILETTLPAPPVRVDDSSDMVGAHLLWAGKTPYLFLVNLDMDNEHVVDVDMQCATSVAYDIVTGESMTLERVGDHAVFQDVSVPPGGWAAYVLPPAKVAGLRLKTAWNANASAVDVVATLVAGDGNPVAAAWPVHIELIAPDGTVKPQSRHTATNADGTWSGKLSPGKLSGPSGKWRVRATDGLTGHSTSNDVTITYP